MFIKVKVKAGEKKESLTKLSGDSFVISVKKKPERGEANARVILLLAGHFMVPEGKIRLVKGGRSPSKIFEIPV